ncbi:MULTISPECIES: DUF3289 family protein [Lonsdalea]|uniref:Uncharacterized protein n=2 Tax=Lonsdalea TaxID=1082702 RepID=A0ACD1JB19_9GAMM|nr:MULTISPECIES: DUF3289 family protein [Lonsdalea]OSN01297.1 hypothetical protein AU499_07225 [Lonsdalea populi]QPQ24973.1 DUF3289 family protein [Lonsdalea populi]RAT12206.1 hypothetical protein AU485_12385 [Lonsdalea quercina]RAT17290.1 hypothetical protein AU487_16035 [Lonsdalea populi]RAT22561.1 hypothetical protein AU488_11085 [Lonsdalea populi]
MLITKRLDELTPDEFTRILSPEKGSALDAKTVVLGSQEHACCSLNAGTLDINASRDFSNTVQNAYARAKVNAPAQKAGWGFAPRPATPRTEPEPTLKVIEVTDTTSATRVDLPILVYETKHKPGLNADGTPAADMLYGDMTKEEITAIPTYMNTHMFAVDDWTVDFESPDFFFQKFREMTTILFSAGDLKFVILAMIAKFEKKEGGEFRHPDLTRAVRAHPGTQAFVNRLLKGVHRTIKKQQGEINQLPLDNWIPQYQEPGESTLRPPTFHSVSDIYGGLTITINDVWAAKAELVQYDKVGRFYTGKIRVTFYDHFGLDIPDVGPDPTNGSIKKYGMLLGFRSWFILQHLKTFGYKPFITVMEMDYPIKGAL